MTSDEIIRPSAVDEPSGITNLEVVRPEAIYNAEGRAIWYDEPTVLIPQERERIATEALRDRPYLQFYLERYANRAEREQDIESTARFTRLTAVVGCVVSTLAQSERGFIYTGSMYLAMTALSKAASLRDQRQEKLLKSKCLI